jgi:hypothetical protein
MDAQEYKDHPEKLMGYQEFKGMGKGAGDPVMPEWLIENRIKDLLEGEKYDPTDNQ